MNDMTDEVRVRFAPSPTGSLHVGGLRTALFNWLFARHFGGKCILRLEDTDQERLVAGSADQIYQALDWLGITPDEGPQQGGPVGPYIQSERLEHYRSAALELRQRHAAYECYCTPERLEAMRAQQAANKQAPQYDRLCRDLSDDERAAARQKNPKPVLRLRVPETGTLTATDRIRGQVQFSLATIDDAVLLKSDGFPTYHLANVVDDHLMNITHVIRAEEWLPSLPKHLVLYQAFGWTPPQFAHLSLLLGKDRSKLSKRHGSVSVSEFMAQGYLPEAMLNYLALLGWNPGDDRELLSRDEIVRMFTLERVQTAGAVFDQTKLDWMNLQYLKHLSTAEWKQHLQTLLPWASKQSDSWWETVVVAVRDRVHRLNEVPGLLGFVTLLPEYDAAQLLPKKSTTEKIQQGLQTAQVALQTIAPAEWGSESVRQALERATATIGDSRSVLWPARVALTGQTVSPPVVESAVLLGAEETQRRLVLAIQKLENLPK